MQGAGRGQDSMLVHMTPGEVQGLQKLALAHGGSLTINPKTGLPEAGFLSSLLPMIAGFALGPGGFQLMTAAQAGLAVGAVSTLATGSLSKGIMAGLGAYGGAGLGGGLNAVGSAAGAAAPTTSTLASALPNATSTVPSMIPNITASPLASATVNPGMAASGGYAGLSPASLANSGVINRLSGVPIGTPSLTSNLAPPPQTVLRAAAQPQVVAPTQLVRPGEVAAFQPRPMDMPTVKPAQNIMLGSGNAPAVKLGYTPSDQLYAQQNPTLAGLKASTSNGLQGFKDLYGAMEKGAEYSGLAAGYSLMNAMNEKPSPPTKKKSLIRPYTLDRQRVVDSDVGPSSSAERQYFNDVYTAQTPYEAPGPEYAASGGMMGMAEGGYVDETMNQDAVGMDSGRPLPQQQPIYMGMQPQQSQQNIIAQPGNTMTTPGFADGGIASFAGGGSFMGHDLMTGLPANESSDTSTNELPQYEYLGNNQYKLKNPVAASTNEGKLSPTGQPVDASGGYIGPYGQYFNAAGQPQMWYMNPANANDPEAIKSAKAAGITLKAPATTATASAPVTTQEGLEALYQQNLGRAADTSGIESYLGKGYTPEQITGFMQASEEYKPIQEKKAAEAKQATYANPTQIANVYDKVFGRTPDMAGLDYYSGQNLTPAEVEKSLRESEEYKKKLTTPLVAPISYTGNRLSYDDIKKQLGHNPSLQEIQAADAAFIPNRATIQGAPEYQTPEQKLGLGPTTRLDSTPDFYAMMNKKLAEQGGYAGGGDINAYSLGGYSDGGRLLRGPGDGVSDDIPASIGDRQPARLADGEFVVPARIVSELGNGSTEAGAKRLYAMMDRVQKARTKTMGKGKVAVNSKADKYLPA
jgi:hypothetical protein